MSRLKKVKVNERTAIRSLCNEWTVRRRTLRMNGFVPTSQTRPVRARGYSVPYTHSQSISRPRHKVKDESDGPPWRKRDLVGAVNLRDSTPISQMYA